MKSGTKTKLNNPEIKKFMKNVVSPGGSLFEIIIPNDGVTSK